jgi:6-phosphofructokinase 1
MAGHAAVEEIYNSAPDTEPQLIGIRENRITKSPLMDCVEKTHSIANVIKKKDFVQAMEMRGSSFTEMFRTLRTLVRAFPHPPEPGQRRLRLAVMNTGGPAAGMNTATRTAIRIAVDKGHLMFAIHNGFKGFIHGEIEEMNWMSVAGWASMGGAELGTNRKVPQGSDMYAIARTIEEHQIEGLLIIGGWAGYEGAYKMRRERNNFPAFNIPIICLPASINNNLPGSDFCIGTDTALNNIIDAVDKIKQSAVASQRCFVVEVMGRYCGYLALISGLATGAERVYMHEEGITLTDLKTDVDKLIEGFSHGKRLGLMIRNEKANQFYTTDFIAALFEEEGGDLFDVRQAILGHLQQGGDPSPFDRIQATRLAVKCVEFLIEQASEDDPQTAFIGLQNGRVKLTDLEDMPRMVHWELQRPKKQWWMDIRPLALLMANSPDEDEAASKAK